MMSGTQTGTQFRHNGGHQDRRHKIDMTAGIERGWGEGHKVDMMAVTKTGDTRLI